jgi:hypothetical protein
VKHAVVVVRYLADLEQAGWMRIGINEDVETLLETFRKQRENTVLRSFYFIVKTI